MQIKSIDDLQVGHWFSICCEEDTYQIEDEDELERLKESIVESERRDGIFADWYAWSTEREALVHWLEDAKNSPDRATAIFNRLKSLTDVVAQESPTGKP